MSVHVLSRSSRRDRTSSSAWAFTLVELLVVIGIISVLISILLPSLSKARNSARDVKCMSNLRSLGQGLQLYATEWKGRLPYGNIYLGVNHPRNQNLPKVLGTMLTNRNWIGVAGFDSLPGLFKCPSASRGDLGSVHYAGNKRVFVDASGLPNAVVNYPLARLKGRGAEVILMADANQRYTDGTPDYAIFRDIISTGSPVPDWYNPSAADNNNFVTSFQHNEFQSSGNSTSVRWRHAGLKRANFLYGDFHVASAIRSSGGTPDAPTQGEIRFQNWRPNKP
jgi:prepilin-type processing-associated H-X9-DG protein